MSARTSEASHEFEYDTTPREAGGKTGCCICGKESRHPIHRTSKELSAHDKLRALVESIESRRVDSILRIGLDFAREILAEHAPETSDAWLPIETAPKDEKPILLGCPAIGAMKDPGSTRVFEGRWNDAQQTWTSMNGFLLLTVATHWMPLPEPPSEKASE